VITSMFCLFCGHVFKDPELMQASKLDAP